MPDPEKVLAAVAIGSNVGDRLANVRAAVGGLRRLRLTEVVAVSEPLETAPVGEVPQGPYLNAAATLWTGLGARELLGELLEIERSRGRDRTREQRWGPRTLDLDLLVFGAAVVDEPGLVVPHPRVHERRFVLEPLSQIAPGLVIPGRGTVRECLDRLPPP